MLLLLLLPLIIHKEESSPLACSLTLAQSLNRSLSLSLDLRAAYIVRVQIREGLAQNENTKRS